MHDKTFQQALEDLHERFSNDFQDTIGHMLSHSSTVTNATLEIRDENMRAAVKNTLLTGQIIALLTLLKEMYLLSEVQYEELATHMMDSLLTNLY